MQFLVMGEMGCGQNQLVQGDPRGVQGEAFGENICRSMS